LFFGLNFWSCLTKYLARFCTLQVVINALIFSELNILGPLAEAGSQDSVMNELAQAIDRK